jgi:hypothetical protein
MANTKAESKLSYIKPEEIGEALDAAYEATSLARLVFRDLDRAAGHDLEIDAIIACDLKTALASAIEKLGTVTDPTSTGNARACLDRDHAGLHAGDHH